MSDSQLLGDVSADAPSLRPISLARRIKSLCVYALMPGLSLVNALVGLLLPLLLGPVEFGQYAITVTLFQYSLIFDLGISQIIDRRVPVIVATDSGPELDKFVGGMLWLRLYIAAGGLVCGCLLLASLSHWGRLPFDPLPGAFSLAAGLFFMITLGPAAVCRAASRRGEFAMINAALMVVLAVARPIGIVLGGSLGCFVLLTLGYGWLAVHVQRRTPISAAQRPQAAAFHLVATQGLPLFLTAFVWAFYMTANRWVVSQLAPEAALGQFAFGSNIVYLIVGAIGALSQFYYPSATARSAAGGAFCVSGKVARDLSLLVVLVTLPTAFGIIAGPAMIGVVYPKFLGAVLAVRILLLAVPGLVLASWLMPLSLSLVRRPWLSGAVIYPIALFVLMATTWIGYRHGGLGSASVGLVLSELPLLLLQLVELRAVRLLRSRDAGMLFGVAFVVTGLLGLLLGISPFEGG